MDQVTKIKKITNGDYSPFSSIYLFIQPQGQLGCSELIIYRASWGGSLCPGRADEWIKEILKKADDKKYFTLLQEGFNCNQNTTKQEQTLILFYFTKSITTLLVHLIRGT